MGKFGWFCVFVGKIISKYWRGGKSAKFAAETQPTWPYSTVSEHLKEKTHVLYSLLDFILKLNRWNLIVWEQNLLLRTNVISFYIFGQLGILVLKVINSLAQLFIQHHRFRLKEEQQTTNALRCCVLFASGSSTIFFIQFLPCLQSKRIASIHSVLLTLHTKVTLGVVRMLWQSYDGGRHNAHDCVIHSVDHVNI